MVQMERLDELVGLLGEAAAAHLRVGRMLKDSFGVDPASCSEFNELSRLAQRPAGPRDADPDGAGGHDHRPAPPGGP